jgi:hypothetical protein
MNKTLLFLLISIIIGCSSPKTTINHKAPSLSFNSEMAKNNTDTSLQNLIGKIKFEDYYGLPIDSLFINNPILEKYYLIRYLEEPTSCLSYLRIQIKSEKDIAYILIYPRKEFKFTKPCIDRMGGRNERWYISTVRREILDSVVYQLNAF